jgi:ABC-type bacteriocin/lantibiotic exporter with double-glycine peptidase domain
VATRRVPLVLQMEAAECGAACLSMVLGAQNRWITLEEARERCSTSRDGLNAADLVTAAQSYGLEAEAYSVEIDALKALPMPQILHWNFDHFVVLESVNGSKFTLLDPASGRRVVDRAEMNRCFTGLTLTFETGPSFSRGGLKPSVTATLLAEARRSPDAMVFALIAGILSLFPALAMSGAVSVFIDRIMDGGQRSWVPYLLVSLLGIVVVKGVLVWLQEWTVAALKTKIAATTALGGFWHALHLPLAFFSQRSAGEVVSRLMLGSEVGGNVAGPLAHLAPDCIKALGFLMVLSLYDPWIAVAASFVACINFFVLWGLAQRLADRNKEQQIAEGRAAAVATSGFAGLSAYRQLGRESMLLERWAAAEDASVEAAQRLGYLKAMVGMAPLISNSMLSGVVLVVGAIQAMNGSLTLGGLVAAQILAGLLNGPIAALAAGFCQMQASAGTLMRIADLEAHPIARAFAKNGAAEPIPADKSGLNLDDVNFAYVAVKPLLQSVSIQFEPGKLVAILGPSGGGKSTLARIAAGLVEPDSGRVTLDGVELHVWPQDELRRQIAYIGQSPASFTGSVADNITLWDTSVSFEKVRSVVNQVGLSDVIERRAGGLSAPMSGGAAAFSGGEMQRLMIARALARNARIIILDETTSALDPENEEDILGLLRACGAAVVIVTHRPGTALRCDTAIRLSPGAAMIQSNKPLELLAGPCPSDEETAARSAA